MILDDIEQEINDLFEDIEIDNYRKELLKKDKKFRDHEAYDATFGDGVRKRRRPTLMKYEENGKPKYHRAKGMLPMDSRVYGGMSGNLIRQTKRLEHIVDELAGLILTDAKPEVIKRFHDAYLDLMEIIEENNLN